MVVNVPIQPLDSSYSAQWHKWIKDELNNREIPSVTVLPEPLVEDTGKGYSDTLGVAYYRAAQLQTIYQLIHSKHIPTDDRVVFLFHNGWWPIEQLAYLRDMFGAHDWKFVGVFRDGTYDKNDLTARNSMYTWGADMENSWFKIYDAVVVGSQFHANTIMEERKILPSKLHVIPWHVEIPEGTFGYSKFEKKNIVVFPHRLDPDKQPEMFDRLMLFFAGNGWEFVKTRNRNLDKPAYYRLLSEAKIVVSCALLEMFGNAMVEAALLGCIPFVPDRLSYRELFRDSYRYHGYEDLRHRVKVLMDSPKLLEISMQHPLRSGYEERLREREFFDDLFDLLETV